MRWFRRLLMLALLITVGSAAAYVRSDGFSRKWRGFVMEQFESRGVYLTLEKLRFNFSYEIQCADEVPVAETAIPSLLLQPLAENAVKHGVSTLQEQGQIRIGITRQGADMVVRISDNGPGFDAVQKQPGYGLKLTRDRIRLLNDMSATTPIILNIISTPGKGATIELLFKNWLA